MRRYLLLTIFLAGFLEVTAQQFYLESGKTISKFVFENSQGENLDNLQSSSHTYISLGYRQSIFNERLFWHASGNFSEYGSVGSDSNFDNYFEWDLTYLGLGLGVDYEIFKPGSFTVYLKASAGAEILIQGTQTLNNQVFNLMDEEDFDSALYVFKGGLGVQYEISPLLSVFTQYMYGTAGRFKDEQGDLKINTHNIGLGLLVNISKNREAYMNQVDNTQIEELKKELEANSVQIEELKREAQKIYNLEYYVERQEAEIAKKEQEIELIKNTISDGLLPYKGKDLTVEERDGKVYIIMGNDLIFESGSTTISAKGTKAINDLGNILAQNKDMNILIEGHTDNVPFENSDMTNWDLSVKRATSIVKLLQNNKDLNPANLEAGGKGEFDPIADNSTAEGRAANRRIEIVLTPKLGELKKLIKD